jgi:nucleotide-binding universal stress UspA family protein
VRTRGFPGASAVSFKKAAMNPIMLATDGSPEAQKATATAIELAKEFGTELVVVAVWELHAAGYGPMGFAPTPIGGELAWLGEDEAQRIAAEAAARAEEAGVETRIRVLRGFPVDVICETAETFAPRILVLGSHGRGAFKRAARQRLDRCASSCDLPCARRARRLKGPPRRQGVTRGRSCLNLPPS